MNANEVMDIGRDAILVMLKVSGPIMVIGLLIGLIISLFQALTQIQEMTLTFVPKMLVVFVSLIVLMPFMLTTMSEFMQQIIDRIVNIG
ncbi:MAG: flagellar biosynthesis protein FliQ [Thalassobaculales bacterium]